MKASKKATPSLGHVAPEDVIAKVAKAVATPVKKSPRKVAAGDNPAPIANPVAAEKAAEQPVEKSLEQLRQDATDLGLKAARKTRAQLIKDIAHAKGWGDEPEEVQAFLVNGGSIKKLPGFQKTHPKPPTPSSASKAAPKPVKAKPERKKKETKPSGDNTTVTLADILAELGVEGRIARRKLRGSDIKKPGVTWEWEAGHGDIAKVKALLA